MGPCVNASPGSLVDSASLTAADRRVIQRAAIGDRTSAGLHAVTPRRWTRGETLEPAAS
jgi:hypothetical protein